MSHIDVWTADHLWRYEQAEPNIRVMHGIDAEREVVLYADHVAEVERAERVIRERVMQVTARAEHVAAEAMRAACLAAVEALLAEFPRDEYPVANSATWTALAALREVQP